MPINKTPFMPLSFKNDIAPEFSDTAPHSLSEFYGKDTPKIPTSGAIKFSDFYGAATRYTVTYTIIGGGGAGGFGTEDGDTGKGTFAKSGGNTVISSTLMGTKTAVGGKGGENATLNGSAGTAGANSALGIGGAGGSRNKNGLSATGYGAGGGGAGGDLRNPFISTDTNGYGGRGGAASVVVTGTAEVHNGETITITIGSGGIGSGGSHKGGDGSQGSCILTYNGKSVSFTTSTTHIVA